HGRGPGAVGGEGRRQIVDGQRRDAGVVGRGAGHPQRADIADERAARGRRDVDARRVRIDRGCVRIDRIVGAAGDGDQREEMELTHEAPVGAASVSKNLAIPVNQRSCAGAVAGSTRPLAWSCHEIWVARGSRVAIASVPACGIAYVTSTTTIGRAPPGSSPSLACAAAGASGLPSSETVSGAIAYAVITPRSAANIRGRGW